jgi:hypothetical protein
MPQAEIKLILGTNHLTPLQNPDAVGDVVQEFVGRHDSI